MASTLHQPDSPKRERSKRRAKLLVIHGPIGSSFSTGSADARATLGAIDARLGQKATSAAVDLLAFQSDREDALIERIHAAAAEGVRFIVIDPAGLTHSSAGLRAALASIAIPFIEVHLSNVELREPLRREPHPADTAVGTIVGLGASGYELALTYALHHVKG